MNTPAGQHFFSIRYIRVDAICLIANCAEQHKWLICCSIDRVLSKNTPRFFTCGFNKIWIDSASVRFMVWREPTSMASVFSPFSLSLLLSIQACTDIYFYSMLSYSRKLSFKNHNERKASAEKICREATQMKDLLKDMAPRK